MMEGFTLTERNLILVVDDNSLDRSILTKILSPEYNILEAEDGESALSQLHLHTDSFAAILLDLGMPVMDGYAFMKLIKQDETLSGIPLIVITSCHEEKEEIKALEGGAWDYITKPYNSEVIKHRLKNAILRSEISQFKHLKYITEYDELTGTYNKNYFYEKTHKMLLSHPDRNFIFITFDIDRFSLINSFFGTIEGDRLIKYIAQNIPVFLRNFSYYTYGRIQGDTFAICLSEQGETEEDIKEEASKLITTAKTILMSYNKQFDIVPSFGLYRIEDRTMPVSIIFDKASLAKKSCKGNYTTIYSWYTREMEDSIEKEQIITNEMNHALNSSQFVPYLQPKYDLKTNKAAGAEALVRWAHPQKGLVSPGVFIPIFERNGFISKLDFYMWESVCKILRNWIDSGKKVVPVSVNISRTNLYNPELVDIICNLVKKYDIPPELLNLELTESSYMDNPALMMETVQRLRDKNFIVLMDDFGSGYSSLNTLKDITVDVLKIDMKFLQETVHQDRSRKILECVLNLAKKLNVPVVAEGAETEAQVKFLRDMGCEFVQGFYFSRPIPLKDFEQLIEEEQQKTAV